MNLLNIKPHVVSRDLSGYITLVYGAPKTGKTTLATQMPGSLLLAFEKGYNAIPGVIAQDITTWGELKQVVRELKKDEVKAVYKSIVIDTIDIAADCCQKYICTQLGIESIGDGGWTNNGWARYKKEFEDVFRTITQLGYAVFFISHQKEKTITPKQGKEYVQICPSLQSSALTIVENMADIYGYAHQERSESGKAVVRLTLRSDDGSVACGGRFKYIPSEIDFSYQALSDALIQAIDKEASEHGNQYVTDERIETVAAPEYDFTKLCAEFEEITGELMLKDSGFYQPRIVMIVDKYLGKGKKVSSATPDQAELIYLIVNEIKDEYMK